MFHSFVTARSYLLYGRGAASGQRCPGRRAHDGRHQRGYGSQQGQDTFGPAGRRGEKDIQPLPVGFRFPRRRGVFPGVSPCGALSGRCCLGNGNRREGHGCTHEHGIAENIPITSGEKTLVLLANYKSDGDGLFQVEPGILAGVSSLSGHSEGQGGDDRPYPVPTEREPADVSYQDGGDQSRHQAPRGLPETCGGENHGQPENRGRGSRSCPGHGESVTCRLRPLSPSMSRAVTPGAPLGCRRDGDGFVLVVRIIPVRGRRYYYYYVLPSGEPEIGKKNDNSRLPVTMRRGRGMTCGRNK